VNSRRPTTTYPVPAAGVVGPDELFQRGVIARRYYLEGRTRVQIAEEFGLSRFKVARMLEEALESGMVEIKILDPASIDIELSTALQRQYSLSTPMQSPPTATTPLTGSRRWPRPPLN
jgi:DNA-binding transcriptional regulator LsrR (DeoR family)